MLIEKRLKREELKNWIYDSVSQIDTSKYEVKDYYVYQRFDEIVEIHNNALSSSQYKDWTVIETLENGMLRVGNPAKTDAGEYIYLKFDEVVEIHNNALSSSQYKDWMVIETLENSMVKVGNLVGYSVYIAEGNLKSAGYYFMPDLRYAVITETEYKNINPSEVNVQDYYDNGWEPVNDLWTIQKVAEQTTVTDQKALSAALNGGWTHVATNVVLQKVYKFEQTYFTEAQIKEAASQLEGTVVEINEIEGETSKLWVAVPKTGNTGGNTGTNNTATNQTNTTNKNNTATNQTNTTNKNNTAANQTNTTNKNNTATNQINTNTTGNNTIADNTTVGSIGIESMPQTGSKNTIAMILAIVGFSLLVIINYDSIKKLRGI